MKAWMSFGKQNPSKPRTSAQELRTDARVQSHRARHLTHVCAQPFTQFGDGVRIRDLQGQEGIRGVLDQFGADD